MTGKTVYSIMTIMLNEQVNRITSADKKRRKEGKNMLYFALDHELYLNAVSRVVYDNVWNCIELKPNFDFDDFTVDFDMDVIKWVDDELSDCMVDKVNVSAWVYKRSLVVVDVSVYGHDVEYGELNPEFAKTVDCNRLIEETVLYRMITEIVKKAAGIAAFEVTQGITKEWSLEGF